MKIIHITPSYKPAYIYGGPIQSIGKLCEGLIKSSGAEKLEMGEKKRLRTEVFTTTANGKSELAVSTGDFQSVNGVPVIHFNRWTKDHSHFSPGLLWGLKKVLQQKQLKGSKTLIHIHAWWNLVSVLSCLIAKWYKIPVVLSPRGMLNSYTKNNRNSLAKTFIHNLIGKRLLSYCHFHATSEQEKAEILEIIKPKSISVIHNLIERCSSQILASQNQTDGFFNLIFLSRIEEKKGLALLFEALALVKFKYRLTIGGSGEEKYIDSLKLKAQELKLTNKIQWLGQISNQDKYQLIADNDLLVLPSYNENFANVVIESLSVGTPVLVSNRVGLSDYINLKGFGWICSLNAEDISKQLNQAYSADKKRLEIRQTASEIIRDDFDDEVLIKKYLEMYKEINRMSFGI